MSNLLHPVGPEPPGVYWRRRVLVLLGILVVLWLLWLLISPGGGKPAASESASALPTLNPSTAAASVDPASLCPDDVIGVTVTSDTTAVTAGEPVSFVMKITNNGSSACNRDVGSDANTFTITSGGTNVWSSDDCAEPGEAQIEEIPPGESFAVKGTWDGTITTAGCGASASPASAGSYQVEASNEDVVSEPLDFTVS